MVDKKQVWFRKEICKNLFEVLLPVVILTIAAMCIPGSVLAQESTARTTELVADRVAGITEAAVQLGYANDTAYRIQPLQDRLSLMDAAVIDGYVNKFADMEKHWSRQVVGKLTGLDIIAGAKGKFMPNDTVQADQFIKMAVRIMGHKIEQDTGYWAQLYIETASNEGLVIKGEIADYKKPLTREQMARIIVRTTLKADAKPDGKYDRYIMGKVNDYHAVADNIKQYVLDGYKLGLITGTDNKFNPKGTLTRAEAAAVIIRFLDVTERKPMKPGAGEIIKLNDSLGVPTEIYPGAIPELFTIAKAAQAAIPKAKGYVNYFIGSDGKFVCAKLYKDKASYEQSIYNKVAAFNIAYNDEEYTYAYTLSVWDDEAYKQYFPDYIREILKTVYAKDAQKAIALHDKYMDMKYLRTDGYNDYTETTINNRNTAFLRYDDLKFGIQIKLKGLK